jgi:hypothetical protein
MPAMRRQRRPCLRGRRRGAPTRRLPACREQAGAPVLAATPESGGRQEAWRTWTQAMHIAPRTRDRRQPSRAIPTPIDDPGSAPHLRSRRGHARRSLENAPDLAPLRPSLTRQPVASSAAPRGRHALVLLSGARRMPLGDADAWKMYSMSSHDSPVPRWRVQAGRGNVATPHWLLLAHSAPLATQGREFSAATRPSGTKWDTRCRPLRLARHYGRGESRALGWRELDGPTHIFSLTRTPRSPPHPRTVNPSRNTDARPLCSPPFHEARPSGRSPICPPSSEASGTRSHA